MPTTAHGWRSLFWFGAGPPVLIIAYRWWLPETNAFQVMRAQREAKLIADEVCGGHSNVKAAGYKAWLRDSWIAIKLNWVLFVYLVILMTGFNSCSHGRYVLIHAKSQQQELISASARTFIRPSLKTRSCWVPRM